MKIIIKIIQIALVAVIIWSGYVMYHNKQEDKEAEERYIHLQQNYT